MILWKFPKCNTNTQGKHGLLEKWHQQTRLMQDCHKPSMCKRKKNQYLQSTIKHDLPVCIIQYFTPQSSSLYCFSWETCGHPYLCSSMYTVFFPLWQFIKYSLCQWFLNNSFFMFQDVIYFMLLVWGNLLKFLGHRFGIFLPTNISCYFYILISLRSFGNCSYLYTQTLRLSRRSLIAFNILDYFFLFGFA